MGRSRIGAARPGAVLIAWLFVVSVALFPGLAGAQIPVGNVTAQDFSFTAASGPIPVGGAVTFSYPAGASAHDVHFSGVQPACSGSTAAVGGANPTVSGPGWSATCTFDTPGTYKFLCDDHPGAMSGTIVVAAPAASTPPAATPPAAAPPSASTPTTTPATGAAATGLLVEVRSGTAAQATLTIAQSGSRIAASLTGAGAKATLGRLTQRRVAAGAHGFPVRLNGVGRRALAARHRLVLTLTVKVTRPDGGAPTTLRRSVAFTGKGSGPVALPVAAPPSSGVAPSAGGAPLQPGSLPPAAAPPAAAGPAATAPEGEVGSHRHSGTGA